MKKQIRQEQMGRRRKLDIYYHLETPKKLLETQIAGLEVEDELTIHFSCAGRYEFVGDDVRELVEITTRIMHGILDSTDFKGKDYEHIVNTKDVTYTIWRLR